MFNVQGKYIHFQYPHRYIHRNTNRQIDKQIATQTKR